MKGTWKWFPCVICARWLWLAVALLGAHVIAFAQTDEIQVYDADIEEKG